MKNKSNHLLKQEFITYLQRVLPIYSWYIQHNELYIYVPSTLIQKIVFFLKYHSLTQYKILIDIAGVDYPTKGFDRFDIVYHFLSVHNHSRISLKICVNEVVPVPTLIEEFPNANWLEREVFDMFGVRFEGHPDLRRILTDYGFKGHPLRKDFPLVGFYELKYDNISSRILYESIELDQNPKMEIQYSPS